MIPTTPPKVEKYPPSRREHPKLRMNNYTIIERGLQQAPCTQERHHNRWLNEGPNDSPFWAGHRQLPLWRFGRPMFFLDDGNFLVHRVPIKLSLDTNKIFSIFKFLKFKKKKNGPSPNETRDKAHERKMNDLCNWVSSKWT